MEIDWASFFLGVFVTLSAPVVMVCIIFVVGMFTGIATAREAEAARRRDMQ